MHWNKGSPELTGKGKAIDEVDEKKHGFHLRSKMQSIGAQGCRNQENSMWQKLK